MEMVMASEHSIQPEYVEGRAPELKVWMHCASDEKLTEREVQTVLAFFSDRTLMFNSDKHHQF
jgi:hypothetical protein